MPCRTLSTIAQTSMSRVFLPSTILDQSTDCGRQPETPACGEHLTHNQQPCAAACACPRSLPRSGSCTPCLIPPYYAPTVRQALTCSCFEPTLSILHLWGRRARFDSEMAVHAHMIASEARYNEGHANDGLQHSCNYNCTGNRPNRRDLPNQAPHNQRCSDKLLPNPTCPGKRFGLAGSPVHVDFI